MEVSSKPYASTALAPEIGHPLGPEEGLAKVCTELSIMMDDRHSGVGLSRSM